MSIANGKGAFYDVGKTEFICSEQTLRRLHQDDFEIENGVLKYGDECKKYISDNDLNECVTIFGEVLNIEEYLLKSDLLIHASVSES